MKLFWLPTLLVVLIALATPAPAKHSPKNQASDKTQSGATTSGDNQDVEKSLDELLSNPTNIKSNDLPAPIQSADDKTLRGALEDSQMLLTAPVVPERHRPKALSGATDENNSAPPVNDSRALRPRQAPVPAQVLKGAAILNGGKLDAAAAQDPDTADQELMVEWDRWRNRFLRAVQLQVQAGVNHPDFDEDYRPRIDMRTGMLIPRFPLGTEAWFYCEVSRDGRIRQLKISQSSGIAAYDRAVLEGVRALDGTSLLRYPRGSHRLLVNQEAGIQTASQARNDYFHFGDVERLRGSGQ